VNAHTTFAAALAPTPNEPEYATAVLAHYPDETGVKLTLRCDLMAFRDRATIGLMRCSADAAPTLEQASRLATIYALANLPTKRLFQMHIAVRALLDAASAIEAASKRGGGDARG
jgi:hypothetical protein